MGDIAIRVENLGKRYRIGRMRQRHDTLREALVAGLRAPLDRLSSIVHRRSSRSDDGPWTADDVIWALKDVSFEVRRGEVLGIIGRNGAGKSTLLKILSRITEPTEGRAEIHGRVGSLLEVGTGFHPELTGRENIYLSGAVLGMRRAEIQRSFDEIVEFSGVGQFLDTPIKRYSSGMNVRLGFAVAAHLEPEILLVDEVLAVGDAAFQKKCLGKMGSVAKGGRTVLFVSHNMAAVQSLCQTSALLRDGGLAADGPTEHVVHAYLATGIEAGAARFDSSTQRQGNGGAQFTSARLVNDSRQPVSSVPMGGSLILELGFTSTRPIAHPAFSARLHTPLGQDIAAWRTQESYGEMAPARAGGSVRLRIRDLNLLPGVYYLAVGLTDGYEALDVIEDALSVEVTPTATYGAGSFSTFRRGEVIFIPCDWIPDYE